MYASRAAHLLARRWAALGAKWTVACLLRRRAWLLLDALAGTRCAARRQGVVRVEALSVRAGGDVAAAAERGCRAHEEELSQEGHAAAFPLAPTRGAETRQGRLHRAHPWAPFLRGMLRPRLGTLRLASQTSPCRRIKHTLVRAGEGERLKPTLHLSLGTSRARHR